jgi:hypothetical protein
MKISRFAIPAVLLALALTGCQRQTQPPETSIPKDMQLHVYDIPKDYGDLQHELNIVLSPPAKSGEAQIVRGRASMTPEGRLLLLAPADIQKAVAAFLKDLPPQKGASSGSAPITVTYWFVAGRPGGRTPDLSGPPWKEIALPLQEIINSQGPMEFDIMERLEVVDPQSRMGADLTGENAEVNEVIRTEDGKIKGLIAMTAGRTSGTYAHRVKSEISVDPGQFLILGQTGFTHFDNYSPFKGASGGAEAHGNTMFYIVRAQIHRQQ